MLNSMAMIPERIGKYAVLRALGAGAMGQVYLAEDPQLGRRVAIKLMRPQAEEGPERFLHEARTVAQLSHPNIVVLHELGQSGDQPYLVMELLAGESLEAWAARPQTPLAKLQVLLGLGRAVRYAHRQEVLHRDLKPSNVQVLPDGEAKLMDFGIARAGSSKLTATGFVIGTPQYLAPEILADASYSPKSDVWALGVLTYELLAGASPFAADNLHACLSRVLHHQPPPLAEVVSDLPAELSSVVMSYLDKDPAHRPATVDALVAVLERLTNQAVATGSLAAPTRRLPTEDRAAIGSPAAVGGGRRWPLWAAGGVVAVAGVVAMLRWQSAAGPPAAASAPVAAETSQAIKAGPQTPERAGASDAEPATALPVAPLAAATPPVSERPSSVSAEPAVADRATSKPLVAKPPATPPPASPIAVEPTVSESAAAAGSALPAAAPPLASPSQVPASRDAPPVASPVAPLSPAPQPAVVTPAARLLGLTPSALRRGKTSTLRVQGSNLPATGWRVEVRRSRQVASGIQILRSEASGPDSLTVALLVDEDAPLGLYGLVFVEADGRVTNSLSFEVDL
jgi:serine/threonine-protein kinase